MNNFARPTRKILIIEDDFSIQKMLREMLKKQKFSIEFASSGTEGLAFYNNGDFCLVVTDINLPGIDGYCVARHLKEKTPSIPIVGMSGLPFQETTNFCHTFGKPFIVKSFVEKVVLLSEPNHACIKHDLRCT